MMRHELNLEKPDKKRARNSGLTVAASYFFAGLIPLSPYIFIKTSGLALLVSAFVTLISLTIFGYIKAKIIHNNPWKSAWQTAVIGGLAASMAFLIAKAIS